MTDYTEVALERFKRIAFKYITRELVNDFAIPAKVDISLHCSFMLDDLALRVRQDIFGKQLEKVDIKYPADWWQAVKDRWFPDWAKHRWPVMFTRHHVDVKALYPSMPEVPEHRGYMNVDYNTMTAEESVFDD